MTARGKFLVEIRAVTDPAGRPAVLLQLPHGHVLMKPADARRVAGLLTETASELEESGP